MIMLMLVRISWRQSSRTVGVKVETLWTADLSSGRQEVKSEPWSKDKIDCSTLTDQQNFE